MVRLKMFSLQVYHNPLGLNDLYLKKEKLSMCILNCKHVKQKVKRKFSLKNHSFSPTYRCI